MDRSFFNRQRFKALADFGLKASQLGASHQALLFQTQAIEITKEENTLSSTDDIVRLEQIKKVVLRNIKLQNEEKIIDTGKNK